MPDGRPAPSTIERACRRPFGFTLLELLLVVGIIALLIGILVPALSTVRRSAASVRCLSNLRQIATAFHQYALDGTGVLPDPFVNKVSWEASLNSFVNAPTVFVCPGDAEVAPAIGTSYDWRDTGKPATTLAGQVLSATARSNAVLAFDALPGWHARSRINAVLLDGSAGAMDEKECFTDLTLPIR